MSFKAKNALLLCMMLIMSLFAASYADEILKVGESEAYQPTADGLLSAIADVADGGSIEITSDITAEKTIHIANIAKLITIDGNGHTVLADFDTDISNFSSNREKQGLISITGDSSVTIKNLVLDANWNGDSSDSGSGAAYVFKLYNARHDMDEASSAAVVLEDVTMQNPRFFASKNKGGEAIQCNTSNLKLVNPVFKNIAVCGVDVDVTRGNLTNKYSKLEIVGDSIYKYNSDFAENSGTYWGNIKTYKKPNIYVIDKGVQYDMNTYDFDAKSLEGASYHPEGALLTNSDYTPRTLETMQYSLESTPPLEFLGITILEGRIYFRPQILKFKSDGLKLQKNITYAWNIKRYGTVDEHNTPEYSVTAEHLPDQDVVSYKIVGKISLKNFAKRDIAGSVLEIKDKKTDTVLFTRSIDVASGEEMELDIDEVISEVDVDNLNDGGLDIVLHSEGRTHHVSQQTLENEVIEFGRTGVVSDLLSGKKTFDVDAETGNRTEASYHGRVINQPTDSTSELVLDDKRVLRATVSLIPTTVKLTFDAGVNGGIEGNQTKTITVLTSKTLAEQGIIPPVVQPQPGYTAGGWNPNFDSEITLTMDSTYTAILHKDVVSDVGSGDGDENNGNSGNENENNGDSGNENTSGETGGNTNVDNNSGNTGGLDNSESGNTIINTDDFTPLAKLNTADHFAYINGYPDGSVRPEGLLTREEVAAIFFRLLDEKYREEIRSYTSDFSDVDTNRWSNKHISTLTKGKILNGYPDGTFRPHGHITRAELAKIASKFNKLEENAPDTFKDIQGHWAEKYIASAYEKGWIDFEDSEYYHPNQYLKRAEFVSFVNNVLDRHVLAEDILKGAREFSDLKDVSVWYYCPMKVATNSYEYEEDQSSAGDIIDDEVPLGNGKTYQKWTKFIYPEIEM